jgi:hypothetical protein
MEGRTNGSEHAQISARVCAAEGNILTNLCDQSRLNGDAIHDVGFNNLKNTCDATASIKDMVYSTSHVIREELERTGDNISSAVYDTSADVKTTVNQNSTANLMATNRVGTDISLAVASNSGESRAQAERIAAEMRGLISDNDAHVLLAAKDQLLEVCKVEGALERQAADNRASVVLDAHKNKEALARQLADCCCEIKEQALEQSCQVKELTRAQACNLKERIEAKTNETNQLIRELDTIKLREELSHAQTENLLFKVNRPFGYNRKVYVH